MRPGERQPTSLRNCSANRGGAGCATAGWASIRMLAPDPSRALAYRRDACYAVPCPPVFGYATGPCCRSITEMRRSCRMADLCIGPVWAHGKAWQTRRSRHRRVDASRGRGPGAGATPASRSRRGGSRWHLCSAARYNGFQHQVFRARPGRHMGTPGLETWRRPCALSENACDWPAALYSAMDFTAAGGGRPRWSWARKR